MQLVQPGRPMKWYVALTVALIAIVAFIGASSVQVCRDWAFICENTGSHKGYRQWCIGLQSGHWYRESQLEQFMRKEHSSELANRWTSYSGTGKNILGQVVLFGHARPGPILEVPQPIFNRYVDGLDDQAKLDLYHVLASGTREEVKAEIDKVWDQEFAQARETQAKRGDHN
jgi:hypothetical protein